MFLKIKHEEFCVKRVQTTGPWFCMLLSSPVVPDVGDGAETELLTPAYYSSLKVSGGAACPET